MTFTTFLNPLQVFPKKKDRLLVLPPSLTSCCSSPSLSLVSSWGCVWFMAYYDDSANVALFGPDPKSVQRTNYLCAGVTVAAIAVSCLQRAWLCVLVLLAWACFVLHGSHTLNDMPAWWCACRQRLLLRFLETIWRFSMCFLLWGLSSYLPLSLFW